MAWRLMLAMLASATALGLSPARAHAGTFSISPVRVELSSGTPTSALTIRNQEDAPVVVQAEALTWRQADGQDQLAPTRDILVSPAVFTLPARGAQLVRVALRRPVDAQQELSYRLLLTEVPPRASPDLTGLNVALRLSLPVFVAPVAEAGPRLEWSGSHHTDGSIALTARNAGNAHARVLSLTVTPVAGSAPALRSDATAYILPGQARTWTMEKNKPQDAGNSADWRRLRVKGTTEAGDFEVETRLEDR